MFTYQKLVSIFKDLTESHKSGIRFVSDPSWVNNRGEDEEYPVLVFAPSGGGELLNDTALLSTRDVWNISYVLVDSLDTDSTVDTKNASMSNMIQIAKDIKNEFYRVYGFNENDLEINGDIVSFQVTSAFTFQQLNGEGMNNEHGLAASFSITDDFNNDCCFIDNFN